MKVERRVTFRFRDGPVRSVIVEHCSDIRGSLFGRIQHESYLLVELTDADDARFGAGAEYRFTSHGSEVRLVGFDKLPQEDIMSPLRRALGAYAREFTFSIERNI